MEKRLFALLSLVGLVILAGCIGEFGNVPGVIQPGLASGVIIKSFDPDLPEVFSDDSVTFTVLVENVGEEEATGVYAKLFGLGTDWGTIPSEENIGELTKAQPSMGVPGGQASATFSVDSPPNLKVDKEYTAKVRVRYTYGTTGVGNIKTYNSDYLKTITQEEARRITTSSGLESWTVTNSPVTIELAGAARPFVVKEGGSLDATVAILISNRGQGYPYTGTDQTVREITIDSIKVSGESCTNWDSIDKTPTIPRTGKKSVSCKFTISSSDVPDFKTIPIEVDLIYNYYLDQQTTVKVLQALS